MSNRLHFDVIIAAGVEKLRACRLSYDLSLMGLYFVRPLKNLNGRLRIIKPQPKCRNAALVVHRISPHLDGTKYYQIDENGPGELQRMLIRMINYNGFFAG